MIWSTNQSPAPQFRKYLGMFNSFIILRTPHHVRHPTKARNNLQNLHPHSNHLKYPKDSSPILPHPTSIPPNKSTVSSSTRGASTSETTDFQAASNLEHRTKSCGMRSAFFPACRSLTVFWGLCHLEVLFRNEKICDHVPLEFR